MKINENKMTKEPAYRFSGHTDAWEQRKLGDNIVDYIEKTTVQNEYPVLTSSQSQGIVMQTDYFANRQVTTENNIGYYILPRGYFTYRSRSDNGVFKFNRNDLIDKGIISYFYPVFNIVSGNSDFYLQMFNTAIAKDVMLQAEGTGQKVLSLKKFKSIKVFLPTLAEQTAIGNFFQTLDRSIALHQRKLDALKEQKKTYLQKLFPRNGETIPEIRFPEFQHAPAWEQRKLGEVLSERNVQQVPTADYPLVSFTVESGVTPKTDRYNREFLVREDEKKYKVTKLNDIVYNPANLKFGAISLNSYGNAVFSPIYVTYEVNKHLAFPDFIAGIVTSRNFIQKALKYQEGTVYERMAVKSDDFLRLEVRVPELAEQTAIGTFFQTLDRSIALHQRKLDKLKESKQTLLKKMFI